MAKKTKLHDGYDWREVAYWALVSRSLDTLEETELTPEDLVVYQFSAKGHELGQLLISQKLGHPMDGVGSYYRSRPMLLGLGLTIEEALMNGLTRADGSSGGRDVGVVSNLPNRGKATAIPGAGDVGYQYTPTVGWAQAIRYRVETLGEREKDGSIAVVLGGDGSVATNGFWASLTIATTLKLPMLFYIEDNDYAISVVSELQTPGNNIAANLASFANLKTLDGDGTEPVEAAALVEEAVAYVRSGEGPLLLRLSVPRLSGHSSVDNQAYKSAETVAAEQARDPIPKLRNYLVPALMSAAEWVALEERVELDVRTALKAALARPEPPPSTATDFAFEDPTRPAKAGGLVDEAVTLPAGSPLPIIEDRRRINFVQAVQRTLDVELALNPHAVVFGEDVGLKGGVHTATMGLQKKFGEARVFDTSLSEEGIMGRAMGMAVAGLTPIPEIQFRKYADPATEQIKNIGSLRWRTNNHFQSPMVMRIAGGFGRKIGDPWHSVTDEAFFAHAVGWQFAFPSNAEDAVGLLRSALRSNNPTVFFEHRAQMDASWARRPYPGDEYVIPFGQATITQAGDELTVVTWGAMVERCELAAADLNASIEIIDLRTIVPWDKAAVLASVRKTSKLLIVHEDQLIAGFGAEIAAVVVSEAFHDLDAPIERIGSPSVPVPFSLKLMTGVVPTVEMIREKMIGLVEY